MESRPDEYERNLNRLHFSQPPLYITNEGGDNGACLGDERAFRMKPIDAQLARQVRVSKMLGLGFVLSVVPMAGIGSLAALTIGLRAKRIIQQSNNEIAGIRMAWWCIIAGAVGAVVFPILFLRLLGWITITL